MKEFFSELFEYNFNVNEKFIHKLQGSSSSKAFTLFSHVLSAHHIWNSRIAETPPSLKVWGEINEAKYPELNLGNYKESIEILNTRDFSDTMEYTNSKGEKFNNTIRDILFHVINHSNYHRAQISSLLKAEGIDPVISDYIFYKR